ncbi:beta strand repeat-containing protein [Sinorhizobium medicae]
MSNSGAVYLFSFTDTTFSGGMLEAVIGKDYTGGKNVDVGALGADDGFGASVSLNAAGDRLAAGAYQDDGSGGNVSNSGAVYLFSFTDTTFSNGSLEAVLGKGYTGGKNVDVAALAREDQFGVSVSLNASGDRLAVAADLDDGSGKNVSKSGAVYLFSFTDAAFSGGTIEAVLGKGYTDGKNVDVAALAPDDQFGISVSLNAAGNRLAVGAIGDNGSGGTSVSRAGAVYLFSFTDAAFSGGTLEAVLGKGYTGGKNVDVATLEVLDAFGSSVSLNADGDLLAVGPFLDDGSGNGVRDSGAVYLFSFTDTKFSGGLLEAVIGKGYSNGKNVNVDALGVNDGFGGSVSLNGAGDRLAVGANLDDGFGNRVKDSGAVYLFSFTDAAFSGGTLEAVIGKGYTGGKNVDVAALENDDWFGHSVSLNASGDRLAVGANLDDGFGNGVKDSGAVYLFSFTDAAFSGGGLKAVIGRGYDNTTGDKNVDVAALESDDRFGSSVSLNAAGDRLAVGAPGDDGHDTSPIIEDNNFGAVYLFSFTDTAFSGGTQEAVIGNGYSGANNVDVSLEEDDKFGSSVSLNALGNLLAIGAPLDDGAGNRVSDSGAVYLFAGILDGDSVSSANYGDDPSADSYILPSDIVSLLSAGTNVTLQANNDITVAEAVAVTDGSARLTLQAGRSVLIDAGITSNGGDVTLIANDLLENGVVDAHRDSGAAVITMAPGTVLDAGTGAVIFDLRAGTGKTKRQGGDITVGTVNAGSILAVNAGPNGKSGIVLGSGSVLTASATGNAIVLAGDRFTNRSGASPLQASGGRWRVWSVVRELSVLC